MLRRSLLFVALAACGAPTGNTHDGPLVWTWSFVDASGAEVGCPANVSTIELEAYQNVLLVGECLGPAPGALAARSTFDCSLGRASLDPQPGTGGCDIANSFAVRVIAKTTDGLTYANEGSSIDLVADGVVEGHTDISVPRGYVHLTWNVVDSATSQPKPCPMNTVIHTTLNRWILDRRVCSLGSAVLTGVSPGPYDFDVYLLAGKVSYGKGSVAGAVVAADSITDATVTIPVL